MSLPKEVFIRECCPRDGWQNHQEFIPTEMKINYIKRMMDCGFKEIEVVSFVNPKVMPQMRDGKEVFAAVKDYAAKKGIALGALALNKRGIDEARTAGAKVIQFGISASEEHSMRNANKTLAEAMAIFKDLARHSEGLEIILGLSSTFGSPFGEEIPLERLKWIVEEARSVGVEHINLADTAGISTPLHTREVLQYLGEHMDKNKVSVHFHDTHGMGIANTFVALEEGITHIESSLAAMGGCPFAPGAKGNIATEDLVNMCEKMGIKTNVDLKALIKVSQDMCSDIHAHLGGSMALACKHE